MNTDLPRERTPSGPGWTSHGRAAGGLGYAFSKGLLSVISSLDVATLPDGSGDSGPQWHISVCFKGKRPKDAHCKQALTAFGFTGLKYDEDNHHPGNARHFFLVVDPTRRVDCECKDTEDVIVEPDGYRWTTPTAASGEACRGCEWARGPLSKGKPCPVHGQSQEARP
jgi:hypothetical protein